MIILQMKCLFPFPAFFFVGQIKKIENSYRRHEHVNPLTAGAAYIRVFFFY